MSQIGYETPQYISKKQNRGGKESFLIRLVLRIGIVKDKKQANIVLLIMTGVFFLTTLAILFSNGIFSLGDKLSEDINNGEYVGEYVQ